MIKFCIDFLPVWWLDGFANMRCDSFAITSIIRSSIYEIVARPYFNCPFRRITLTLTCFIKWPLIFQPQHDWLPAAQLYDSLTIASFIYVGVFRLELEWVSFKHFKIGIYPSKYTSFHMLSPVSVIKSDHYISLCIITFSIVNSLLLCSLVH